jgi:myo-inositol-1(or 4)-monophosphatase
MTQVQNTPSLDQVVAWAKAAGKIARDGFLNDHKLGYKGATDIVTEIDHQCEDLILGGIRDAFPGHAIFSEESGALAGEMENTWYVDPLDGTVNYAHRIPFYVISIAYAHKGELTLGVVYDPSRDECYSAERDKGAWLNGEPMRVSTSRDLHKSLLSTGFPYHDMSKFDENLRIFSRLTRETQGVRRMGCAALEMCYVARGLFDGYWEQEINAWDIAASSLITLEAGGVVTDLLGGADFFKPPYALVASGTGLHPLLLESIQKYGLHS